MRPAATAPPQRSGWVIYATVLFLILSGFMMVTREIPSGGVDERNWRYWESVNDGAIYDHSVRNPVQGLWGLSTPFSPWLNPAQAIANLFGDSPQVAKLVNALIDIVALFWLGMIFRLRTTTLAAALFLYLSLSTANFGDSPGEFRIFEHLIPIATLKCLSILWVALYLSPRLAERPLLRCAASSAIILYASLVNFLYLPLFFIYMALVVGAVLVFDLRKSTTPKKFAAEIGVYLVLALFSAIHYHAFTGGIARNAFPNEIYSEPQTFDYLNAMPFRGVEALTAYGVVLLSAIFNCLSLKSHRGFFAGMLGVLALMPLLGAMYTFSGLHWKYPSPVYLEQGFYALMLTSVVRSIDTVVDRLKVSESLSPLGAVILFACATVPLTGLADHWGRAHSLILTTSRDAARATGKRTMSEFLKSKLSLEPGGDFKGSVCLLIGIPGGPFAENMGIAADAPFHKSQIHNLPSVISSRVDPGLDLVSLWENRVPTLRDNNHMVSAFKYHFFSRLICRKNDFQSRNWLIPTKFDPDLFPLLGVKYVLSDDELAAPDLVKLSTDSNSIAPVHLYELKEHNTGDYYPTEVVRYGLANELYESWRERHVEFSRQLFLHESQRDPGALVQGETRSFRFTKDGAIRLEAASPGKSVVILPVEYSPSLVATGSGKFELIRADLLLLGVVFEGAIDIAIEDRFSMMAFGSWLALREEAEKHGVLEDHYVPYPDAYQPHAIPALSSLLGGN